MKNYEEKYMRWSVRLVACLLFVTLVVPAHAVPAIITYQGSLKQNGVPVNATVPISVNVTDANGVACWTGATQQVQVKEGLYRYDLTPTTCDLTSSTNLYVQTVINNNKFTPLEPLNSVPYALMTKDIAPGATAKGDLYVMGGNLGIGTTQPMEALDVNGGSNFRDNFTIPSDFQIGVRYHGPSFHFFNDGTTRYADVNSDWRPAYDNGYYLGNAGRRWISVYAANGVIQTSSSRLKKEIREIAFKPDGSAVVNSISNSAITMLPSLKLQTIKGSDGKDEEIVTPNSSNLVQYQVPRAILFKWKNPTSAKEDQDMLGFMGDDLPLEAHAIRPDGTRDPNSFYTSAVVGLLCAKVRAQDDLIKKLTARMDALEAKGNK